MYDGAETFEYRLVPLCPDIPPVSRRNKAEDRNDETTDPAVYSYPFDALPPIFSRVKPHFVVCDAGGKLDSIFPRWNIPTSGMACIYGISDEKVKYATLVVYQSYCTWIDHVHPATFVISPRTNDSRPRSGLIRPGQPTSAS